MPFKTDAQGNIVTADHNGKKLPVFINAKGEESPFDADSTVETISRLNGEAKTHREAKEALDKIVKGIPEGILKDPSAAAKALELVANLDAKKLVDAGEIERVKNEIGKAFEGQLNEAKTAAETLRQQLHNEMIGGAFARSPLIVDGPQQKFAIPADFVQARFGDHFGIEDGRVYAVDGNGQKLYSRVRPGELASFDEALTILVDAHPQKDSFLKGSGGNGGGAQNGGGNQGGGKPQGNLGGTRTERQQAIAARFPDLATNNGA